ncbi:putative dipeptidase ytjP [[Clostridium] ultunense Esp]|nr:putative dipeptidase ytjP [[Clostridium] ultunense Esp]
MMDIDWLGEVEKRKEELVRDLQEFLQIPSVLKEEAKEGAPFGPDVAKALGYILDLSSRMGMRTQNLDGYIGYGEFGDGKEMVGILCHVDVVPPGKGWSVPPFSGRIIGDRIVSRGASDDKGPTIAALYGAKIVKELGLPLKRRVRLIFGTDEESEWRCIDRYNESEEKPVVGFAPDADFPLIFAEKGLYNVALRFHLGSGGKTGIHLLSFTSGERSNMVPDYAEARLKMEDPRLMERIKETYLHYLKEKGYPGEWGVEEGELKLAVKGVSAHGSLPELGEHAGWRLAAFLNDLTLDQEGSRFIELLNHLFLDDPKGKKLEIEASDPVMGDLTVNVGVISYPGPGGEGEMVKINIRYPSSTHVEEIRGKILSKIGPYGGEIVKEDKKLTPHLVPKDHPLVKTLLRVYRSQTGDTREPLAIGGATYARSLPLGVAFGAAFPGREDVAHQKDEYILLDDLVKATAIYAQAIYELANMELVE